MRHYFKCLFCNKNQKINNRMSLFRIINSFQTTMTSCQKGTYLHSKPSHRIRKNNNCRGMLCIITPSDNSNQCAGRILIHISKHFNNFNPLPSPSFNSCPFPPPTSFGTLFQILYTHIYIESISITYYLHLLSLS